MGHSYMNLCAAGWAEPGFEVIVLPVPDFLLHKGSEDARRDATRECLANMLQVKNLPISKVRKAEESCA